MEIKTKKCSKCDGIKILEDFPKHKYRNGGVDNTCKTCKHILGKKWYKENKTIVLQKQKEYYQKNREDKIIYQKKYHDEHRKERNIKMKTHYDKNKEKIAIQSKIYRKNNQELIALSKKTYNDNNRDKRSIYCRNKKKTDVNYKLRCTLRTGMHRALKNDAKAGSAVRDLGCSVQELKLHLESLFTEGMDWNNWTIDGWHIDHIKPLSKFDLTKRKELLKACHYSNLRPLWAIDNLKKGSKYLD